MKVTTPAWDAGHWVNCPASALMRAMYPEGRKFEKDEGSVAHWCAEEALRGRDVAEGTEKDGFIVDAYMLECVEMYLDDIAEVTGFIPIPRSEWLFEVEQRLPMDFLEFGQKCRVDFYARPKGQQKLYLWDYKHGRTQVKAENNWQLLLGAKAAMAQCLLGPEAIIDMRIVQPRAQVTHSKWVLTGAEVDTRIAEAMAAAKLARQEDPPYKTGEWCLWCNGLGHCPGAKEAALAAFELSGAMCPDSIQNDPVAMATEWQLLRRAKQALSDQVGALEEQLIGHISRGAIIPGLRKGYTSGKTKWTVDPSVVLNTGQLAGVNVAQPVTPSQAIRAGMPRALVESMSARNHGRAVLEEVDNNLAKNIFGGN